MNSRTIFNFYTLKTPNKGRGGHQMDFPVAHDFELADLAKEGIFPVNFDKGCAGFAETNFNPTIHQALLDEVTSPVDALVIEALYHTTKPPGWQK